MADKILVMAADGSDGQPDPALLHALYGYVTGTLLPALSSTPCPIVTLFNDSFTRSGLQTLLESHPDVGMVVGVGHGRPDMFRGWNGLPVLNMASGASSSRVENLLADRIVHLVACSCGARLAQWLVMRHGARALYAHTEIIRFAMPLQETIFSDICRGLFLPPLLLAQGRTIGQAYRRTLAELDAGAERHFLSPFLADLTNARDTMCRPCLWSPHRSAGALRRKKDRGHLIRHHTALPPEDPENPFALPTLKGSPLIPEPRLHITGGTPAILPADPVPQ